MTTRSALGRGGVEGQVEVKLSDHFYNVGETPYKLGKFKLPFIYEWTS